jgi:hypothetical protein
VAIRQAAAGELDVVLHAEKVTLPVLEGEGPFPYEDLLKMRTHASARAFRELIQRRDAGTADLLQEYLAAIPPAWRGRLGLDTVRFLVTTLVGVVPIAGIGAAVLDKFGLGWLLHSKTARYFVDSRLRRLSTPGDIHR